MAEGFFWGWIVYRYQVEVVCKIVDENAKTGATDPSESVDCDFWFHGGGVSDRGFALERSSRCLGFHIGGGPIILKALFQRP